MAHFDLVVKGGTVATASDAFRADIGVKDGRVTALAEALDDAAREIDATGKLVLPGAIEAHCHIEQESSTGAMTSDDYYTGSVSAAFGGNTTIIPFAAQHRGQSIADVLDLYHGRSAPKSVIDYSFHLIVTDPTDVALKQDLPRAFEQGITSFKVFMTYDKMIVSDEVMLDILAAAKEHGALTMVHAENNAMIKWMVRRLLARGHSAPRYHAISHPAAAEVEAIHRAAQLAGFLDAPLLIVHVSTDEGANFIAEAKLKGQKLYGETCPQYFFLTKDDLDRPGADGAKYCCSPPLRDAATQAALWRHLQAGTFHLFSSDHAPYRFDETGKLSAGPNPPFNRIANGMPGIELRAPLLFSEGVAKARITLNQFISLTATNAAKLYGLHPRKGTIAIGSDADLAIWDPSVVRTITAADLHDNMDYTPFEGMTITGWPTTVISRGDIVVEDGVLKAASGRGVFLKRSPFQAQDREAGIAPELDVSKNFGASLL